jgi:hypothetical protein
LSPSPCHWSIVIEPMYPVQPERRWTPSLDGSDAPILTVTLARLTAPVQLQGLPFEITLPLGVPQLLTTPAQRRRV